jgi:hypothetical protein
MFVKNSAKNSTFVQKATSSTITLKVNFTMTLVVNFILMLKFNFILTFILIFLKAELDNMKKQGEILNYFFKM